MSNPIGWTDQTWNPVVGCSHVSPGCDHCYAERMAFRLVSMGKYPPQVVRWCGSNPPGMEPVPEWSGKVAMFPDKLDQPLHWRKPRHVFVCSMGDLFHEDVPDDFILRVLTVAAQPIKWGDPTRHTFQILTKRPGRMLHFMQRVTWKWGTPMGGPWRMDETGNRPLNPVATLRGDGYSTPLSNIWLGVTAENQEQADERIPILLQTPAAVRFVSCEPLLEPVSFAARRNRNYVGSWLSPMDDGRLPNNPSLDWVIVGGENGPGARLMQPEWARDIRWECHSYGVPFWFKGGLIDGVALHQLPEGAS